ncbi:MAG: phosphatase PAP2 family protein [Xanthobacteraceae bacterium]
MTANNNTARRASSPLSHARLILTRIGSNLQLWIVALFRKPKAKTPRIGVGPVVLLVGLITVIIASMFLLDAPASEWARQLPPWVAVTGDEISNFALGSRFSYPLGLFILLLAALTRPSLPLSTRGVLEIFAARAGFLFIAIGLPGLFDTVVKRLIGRARPYVGAHDDPFAYKPFIWRPDYASMPSGHSTTAAAAAIAIGAIWPQARPVVWLYALIIMSARVVMNVHHPSDVIAGALVGVIGALMIRRWFAARRLVFFAHDLRAFPGPSWRRIRATVRRVMVDVPTRAA